MNDVILDRDPGDENDDSINDPEDLTKVESEDELEDAAEHGDDENEDEDDE